MVWPFHGCAKNKYLYRLQGFGGGTKKSSIILNPYQDDGSAPKQAVKPDECELKWRLNTHWLRMLFGGTASLSPKKKPPGTTGAHNRHFPAVAVPVSRQACPPLPEDEVHTFTTTLSTLSRPLVPHINLEARKSQRRTSSTGRAAATLPSPRCSRGSNTRASLSDRASTSSQNTQRSSNVWCSESGSSFTAFMEEPLFDSMVHKAILTLQPPPSTVSQASQPTSPACSVLYSCIEEPAPRCSPLLSARSSNNECSSGGRQALRASEPTPKDHQRHSAPHSSTTYGSPRLLDRRTCNPRLASPGPFDVLNGTYQQQKKQWLQAKWEQSQVWLTRQCDSPHAPSMPVSSASMRQLRCMAAKMRMQAQAGWDDNDNDIRNNDDDDDDEDEDEDDEGGDEVSDKCLPFLPEQHQQCSLYRLQGLPLSVSQRKDATYEVMEGFEDRASWMSRRSARDRGDW